jgi:hypothetical protein
MKMLGRFDQPLTCRYGCCRQYASKGKRAVVRSAKRRERRAWRRGAESR